MNRTVLLGGGSLALALAAGVGVATIIFPDKEPNAARVALICEVRVSDADRASYEKDGVSLPKLGLLDGGSGSRTSERYTTVIVGAWKQPDGGYSYPKLDFGEILDPGAACTETPLGPARVDAGELKAGLLRCACSTGKLCTRLDLTPAPMGVTLRPGEWLGLGCVPKSCGPERFGETGATWPADCPDK